MRFVRRTDRSMVSRPTPPPPSPPKLSQVGVACLQAVWRCENMCVFFAGTGERKKRNKYGDIIEE